MSELETLCKVFDIESPTTNCVIHRDKVDLIVERRFGRKTTDEEWKWVIKHGKEYIFDELVTYQLDHLQEIVDKSMGFFIGDLFRDEFFNDYEDE